MGARFRGLVDFRPLQWVMIVQLLQLMNTNETCFIKDKIYGQYVDSFLPIVRCSNSRKNKRRSLRSIVCALYTLFLYEISKTNRFYVRFYLQHPQKIKYALSVTQCSIDYYTNSILVSLIYYNTTRAGWKKIKLFIVVFFMTLISANSPGSDFFNDHIVCIFIYMFRPFSIHIIYLCPFFFPFESPQQLARGYVCRLTPNKTIYQST